MGKAFSLYLDGLRLLGAVMVLLAHWAFPRFTGEDHLWMRQHDLGGDGVVIFFVLSGLLIAYAAENRREEGPALFAADRLSRLWSVALPALFFCLCLDMIGQRINPEIYRAVGYEGGLTWNALLAGAAFVNEIWFISLQPGSNGPYWSLGYEAWYYAIFAGFFFAPARWRWWLAVGLALIAGPKILLLAPSWLLGVWVWRTIKSGKLDAITRPKAAVLAAFPLLVYFWCHANQIHWLLYEVTEDLIGTDGMALLGFSDTFLWSAVLGVLTAMHVLGVAALLQGQGLKSGLKVEHSLRWLAGGSFALYLVHFPVLHLAGAVLPGDLEATWRQIALLVLACGVSYAFAEITERRRPALRARMRNAVRKQNRRDVPAAATSSHSLKT